ncbi:dimer_Tnp_hAT domain-containing protein [Trichonephila clavipes]|nr:dimer_Tnp_hAT domain-containing protein [Trichonephila clavipes]
MNQTCFQYVEDWSETNITRNNSFQWYFCTSLQIKWADIENCVEFLSKELPHIKIDDNGLFEEERRLNTYLNSNTLEQLENQHAEIDKRWVKTLKPFQHSL